ncbi:disulfide isomerase 1-3 [Spatholobus suberectus]|nr:disulfide isomerase 1-3 [Spatholobus suberectus]
MCLQKKLHKLLVSVFKLSKPSFKYEELNLDLITTTTSHHNLNNYTNPDHFTKDDDFSPSLEEVYKEPTMDNKNVILKEHNFTTVVKNNCFLMVEFYTPNVVTTMPLTPKYVAATKLKKLNDFTLSLQMANL